MAPLAEICWEMIDELGLSSPMYDKRRSLYRDMHRHLLRLYTLVVICCCEFAGCGLGQAFSSMVSAFASVNR
jgi:hypothetical protein